MSTVDPTESRKWRFDNEHKLWRQQYRARRYLEHLKLEELVIRAEDVLTNNLTLNRELKVGLYPRDIEAGYWAKLFTDILEECVLRNMDHRQLLAKVNRSIIPKYDLPGLENAIAKIKTTQLETDNYLIKYGQVRYLLPLLEKGEIRIAPASSYEDPSLNPAVRDSELELRLYSLPSEVSLVRVDAETGQDVGKIDFEGYVERTIESPTNYYVYCLSNMFSPKMFGDFEADSCLVIQRPREFVSLLSEKLKEKLPDWICEARLVNYIDPFSSEEFSPRLPFSKHFRYAYQKEYRVVWLPATAQKVLDPLFLQIGDLHSYCELIDFGPTVKGTEE